MWRALRRVVVETWEDCWPGELRGPPPMEPRDIMESLLLFDMVEVGLPEGVSGGCGSSPCVGAAGSFGSASCWVPGLFLVKAHRERLKCLVYERCSVRAVVWWKSGKRGFVRVCVAVSFSVDKKTRLLTRGGFVRVVS